MKNFMFWMLDKILFILMIITILLEDSFSSFEKCVLILIVGVMISLDNIKDVINSNSKVSK